MVWLYNARNILKLIEIHNSNREILQYTNYISIKLLKKHCILQLTMFEQIEKELVPVFGAKQHGMEKLLPEKASQKTELWSIKSMANIAGGMIITSVDLQNMLALLGTTIHYIIVDRTFLCLKGEIMDQCDLRMKWNSYCS